MSFRSFFTFSSHTEYVKRESIVIAWVKKKNSLLLTNVYDLYVLEDKTNQKQFPSVCLSGCLDVRTYVDFSCGHNNFRRSYRIQKKFGGCRLCMKCRSGIEIQSNIMILTLTLISQKLCGATPNLVDIFSIWRITFSNEFHSEILILHMILIRILKKKKILKKVCGTKLNFMSIINI